MKNQISAFLLMFWTLGAITTGSFFSTKANPEEKNIVKTERINSNAQFSTTTSFDDLNVYGSATLTEDSPSGLSYRITMTITSPLGRTNTTQSDWSLTPLRIPQGFQSVMKTVLITFKQLLKVKAGVMTIMTTSPDREVQM